ncbi:unnamed protein product [Alternaria alternata]
MPRWPWLSRKQGSSDVPSSPDNPPIPPSAATASSSRKVFPSGLKLLHDGESSIVDLIFIHGLTGDREKTWTAKDATAPWAKTLLPSKIPNARILTFGYDAYVSDWGGMVSKKRIGNHAMNLLSGVASYREEDDTDNRPIIFICHSLGGLVCEDALATAQQRPEAHIKRVLDCCRGIVFLGTPHHGSGLAHWAESLAKAIGVLKQTNAEILAVLKGDSEVLERIQGNFHTMIRARSQNGLAPIEITCFYEELPLPGVGTVVPMHSAILPGYIPIGIRQNHMGMTKFCELDDPGFVAIVGEVRRWVKALAVSANDTNNTQEAVSGTSLAQDTSSSSAVSQILLLVGKAGSGKSVLLYTIYQEAVSKPTNARAFSMNLKYFFDATRSEYDKSYNSRRALLQSILYQFLEATGNLSTPRWNLRVEQCLQVLKATKKAEDHTINGEESIWSSALQYCIELLVEGLNNELTYDSVKIRIFIDALDECSVVSVREVIKFLEFMIRAQKTRKVSIHICISCRREYDGPQASWKGLGCEVVKIELDATNSRAIREYIHRNLERYESVNVGAMTAQLVGQASGVFLWVKLVVDAITEVNPDQCDPAVLHDIIHEMPPDLDSVYARMLDRQRGMFAHTTPSETISILQIVLYGQKAFTVSELRAALLLQKFQCNIPTQKAFMEHIENSCQGLVEFHEVDDEEPTIRLIHDTARSFLLGNSGLKALVKLQPDLPLDFEGHSHLALLRLCMVVFDSDNFEDEVTELRREATQVCSQKRSSRTSMPSWKQPLVANVEFSKKYAPSSPSTSPSYMSFLS